MVPVQLTRVDVFNRRRLVGQLTYPGGEFESDTARVSVLMSTGAWYCLEITELGWQLRLEHSLEPPAFLRGSTGPWQLMWPEIDRGLVSLDCMATLTSADLIPAKQPGDDSIVRGDAMRFSVKASSLNGVDVLDKPYEGLFAGTIEEITMTVD